ncbi:MAG TPA: ferredoxin reductase [Acidimicrobiales bacterium]|jgi:ferredoxin-NADP reductase
MLTESKAWGALRRALPLLDAAATPHGVDRYLELVAPTWSSAEVRGRVQEARRQTPDTVTLRIEANRNWRGFEAGQYVELTVEIDGVRHTRCYSMASCPGSGRTFELTVKAQPGGVVSPYLVARAKPGLVVGLSQAGGTFTLPDRRPGRTLLISGGSGITPVLSMLRTLCDEGHGDPVTFVHYARTSADMTYRRELAALAQQCPNVRLVSIFTEEPGAGDLDGLACTAQLDAIDPAWREAQTFLCGPAPLMEALGEIYRQASVSAQLHTEAFTLAQFVAEVGDVGGTIRFRSGPTVLESDGTPLLAQAEAAGLRPASGCRMGICHTCACRLKAGMVRNVVTGELSEAGDTIRICVSAPVGDVDVDV